MSNLLKAPLTKPISIFSFPGPCLSPRGPNPTEEPPGPPRVAPPGGTRRVPRPAPHGAPQPPPRDGLSANQRAPRALSAPRHRHHLAAARRDGSTMYRCTTAAPLRQ